MLTTPVFSSPIRPIFVVGAPRSGTSITNWALGQHPNIQPMPETSWIASLVIGAYQSYEYGSSRGRYSHLSNVGLELAPFMRRIGEAVDGIVNDCFNERCEQLYGPRRHCGRTASDGLGIGPEFQIRRSADDPKQRWVDATPLNSYFMWILSAMFPSALFIHNLRPPHEVATSLEGFDKLGLDALALELREGLSTWASHTEHAWLGERALGEGRVFRLKFDRIANEPEALLREVCDFLGEDYSPDCLRPLGERINSSQVDSRRKQNLERLRDIPEYQAAEALYDQVLARPAAKDADPEATDLLRNRFAEYCRSHPLL